MVSSLISSIKGTLESIGRDWTDITVSGVTFRINVTPVTIENLPPLGNEVKLFTSLQVREDSLTLYGFTTEEERLTFDVLIGITGIGPKVALSILSRLTPATLASAVSTDDIIAFTNVPGIGKKTASRILLELKGKIQNDWALPKEDSSRNEVVDALIALGYSAAEAKSTITDIPTDDSMTLEEKLREALQRIGNG